MIKKIHVGRITIINAILLGITISVSFGRERLKEKPIINREIAVYQQPSPETYMFILRIWQANQANISTNPKYLSLKLFSTDKSFLDLYHLFVYKGYSRSFNSIQLLYSPLWINYTWFRMYNLALQSGINNLSACNCLYTPELDFEKLAKPLLLKNQPLCYTKLTAVPEPFVYLPEQLRYKSPLVSNLLLSFYKHIGGELSIKYVDGKITIKDKDMEIRERMMFKRAMSRQAE